MSNDDIARMLDRLMERVDRIENTGEEEAEIAIQERAIEAVEVSDEAFVQEDVIVSEIVLVSDEAIVQKNVVTSDAVDVSDSARETMINIVDNAQYGPPIDQDGLHGRVHGSSAHGGINPDDVESPHGAARSGPEIDQDGLHGRVHGSSAHGGYK